MAPSSGFDDRVLERMRGVSGIVRAERLRTEDFQPILQIESEAEKRSILGMGKLSNSGLREVLHRSRVYVALTDMNFDWGCRSSLLLKKGEVVVGEEVHDEDTLRALRETPNVWFMHDSFVVYKDRMSFPKDLADDSCRFEIPSLPAEWLPLDDMDVRDSIPRYANPSPPCDLFLKQSYFPEHEEEGLGTILVGIND